MGGLEQKVEKIENLMNLGKYKAAIPILLELLNKDEINKLNINIYDKFLKALNKISEEEKDNKIKYDIYIKSFKYLNEENKDDLRVKIVDSLRDKNSTEIEKIAKSAYELNDDDLTIYIKKLLDNTIIEENAILTLNDIKSIEKNITNINKIYPRLQLKSSKKFIHNKIIDSYIKKAQKIAEIINNLTEIDKISSYLNYLNSTIEDFKRITNLEEENDIEASNYLKSLNNRCNSYLLMTEGTNLINAQNFELAYDKFSRIKGKEERNELQIELKEADCIKSIGKHYEDEENYEMALKFYKKNNKFKENEIRVGILSYYKSAKNFIKIGEYEKSLDNFVVMFKEKKNISKLYLIENIFNDVLTPFLNALTLYCKTIWDKISDKEIDNKLTILNDSKQKLDEINKNLKGEILNKYINEAIAFIEKLKGKTKNNILIIEIMNSNINHNLPVMNQRIYMEILINLLYSETDNNKRIKILNIIIKYCEEGLYISKNNLIQLRDLFSLSNNRESKKLLKTISKLYSILSKNGIELEKNTLLLIGNTIISLIKDKNKKNIIKKNDLDLLNSNKEKMLNNLKHKNEEDSNNLYSDEEFNEILINLFVSMEKLLREKDYQLNNVEKIYNLVLLKSNLNNNKLLDTLLNGYYYFYEKNLVFSNITIDNLLTILLEKEENAKLFDIVYYSFKNNKDLYHDYIPKFFKLIFKYDQQEENILKLINSIKLPYQILNDFNFKQAIDEYINKDKVVYYDLIFLIIKQLSISDRTEKMMEKLSLYEEKEENQRKEENNESGCYFQEINKRKMRLKRYEGLINSKINLSIDQLRDIEDNLSINGFFDLLIKLLINQKELIDKININLLSQYFNKDRYEYFIKINSENRINWTERALTTIISGFSKNDENEKKAIIKLLENISNYQTLPLKIKKNLEFEKNFLKVENMKNISKMDLFALLENFKEVNYFSYKYYKKMNELILSCEKNSDSNKNMIYKKIIELLKSSSFNVSPEILEICFKKLGTEYFSKSYAEILSNLKIQPFIKKVIFEKVDDILKNSDEKLKMEIIKEIKYFIDWEMLTPATVKILSDNLVINNDDQYNEISKEIIYILGVIYSICNDDIILEECFEKVEKIKNQKLYKLIHQKMPKLNEKYIFYIYSLIIFYEKNVNENRDYKTYPRKMLLDKIKEKLKTVKEKENFEFNFYYFEKIHEFEQFSPKRDKYIRKLFFNKRIDATKISQILLEKSKIESRIESTVGQKINGKLFGSATIYYTNGEIYIGNFLNNKKEGEGVFYKDEFARGEKQYWRDGKLVEDY